MHEPAAFDANQVACNIQIPNYAGVRSGHGRTIGGAVGVGADAMRAHVFADHERDHHSRLQAIKQNQRYRGEGFSSISRA
jgi:hypothetical protein